MNRKPGWPIAVVLLLLVAPVALHAQSDVWIENIDGLHVDGQGVYCGDTVEFFIYLANPTEFSALGADFRFVINSPDGGTVEDVSIGLIDTTLVWQIFDMIGIATSCPFDGGVGSRFLGNRLFGGLQAGDTLPTIRHAVTVPCSSVGTTICIDSSWSACYVNPAFHLVLNSSPQSTHYLTWQGKQCFEVRSCCYSMRGDMNQDGDILNPVDHAFLTDYLFAGGPEPTCDDAADLNGDGGIADPVDLAYSADYLFSGGPQPVACP